MLSRGLFWCLFAELRKITLNLVHKQFVTRVHTLLYFLHDITNPYMMIKMMIFTQRPCVSLPWFTFCWWHHSGLLMTSQWPDNYDAITWIVISNLLDIDFILGNIHGWSCKKPICYCSRWAMECFSSEYHGEYSPEFQWDSSRPSSSAFGFLLSHDYA